MAAYEFNEDLKLILPDGFVVSKVEGDEGKEITLIRSGAYKNDDGEIEYEFSCQMGESIIDSEDGPESCSPEDILRGFAEDQENVRYLITSGSPTSLFLTTGLPMTIFGVEVKMYTMIFATIFEDAKIVTLNKVSRFNEDDPDEMSEMVQKFYEVVKALRYKGASIDLEDVSPEWLATKLYPVFEEGSDEYNISLENLSDDDDDDGEDEYDFKWVEPDEKLYPNYSHLKYNPLGFLGASINPTGTEFQATKFSELVDTVWFNTFDDEGDDTERKQLLYEKILEINPEGYTMDKTATEMTSLFHVDATIFNGCHDREVELTHGYMRRAYMLSALRSFAWTLADYCNENDLEPEDVDIGTLNSLAFFVENRNWLNYDGNSYCKGLCSGRDLNVYYVPDAVTKSDRKELAQFNEEVLSLEALRTDLEYIYPAVQTLYNDLFATRDTGKHLEGAASDVVYAWIAMALAAAEPFYTDDGPWNYEFDQPGAEYHREVKRAEEKKEMQYPVIASIEGTGYQGRIERIEHVKVGDKVLIKADYSGCFYNPVGIEVFNLADETLGYLQKDSDYSLEEIAKDIDNLEAEVSSVTPLSQRGKRAKYALMDIKITRKDDLKKSSSATKSNRDEIENQKTFTSAENISKSVDTTNQKGIKLLASDCNISKGVLIEYNGSEEAIILPDGIRRIDSVAFSRNESLTAVVIPEGVEEIGGSAFDNCENLVEVSLPSTLRKIGDYAFGSCTALKSITIPEGVEEIGESTFINCENLVELSLPSTLCKIGDYAFGSCTALKSITIPEGVEEIGEGAFSLCKELRNIYVPDSVRTLGVCAFIGCHHDKVIHTALGSAAEQYAKENDIKVDYEYCANIQLPVTAEESTSIQNIILQNEEETISSDDYEIEDNGVLTYYYGSESDLVIPEGVRSIGRYVFANKSDILSVVIPAGVETIEDYAFCMCINLQDIVLPQSLKKIGVSAFGGCKKLRSILIPNKVEEIGEKAFTLCGMLDDIYLPISVCDIGENAFNTFNDDLVIHTPAGSYAETFAEENGLQVDHDVSSVYDVDEEVAELSAKAQAALCEVEGRLRNLQEQLAQMQQEASMEESSNANTTYSQNSAANSFVPKIEQTKKEGCYIATAVYGSYDAPEVLVLRRFRDTTLRKSAFGRWFIRMYYRLSPLIAAKLKKTKHINGLVRRILNRLVEKLSK